MLMLQLRIFHSLFCSGSQSSSAFPICVRSCSTPSNCQEGKCVPFPFLSVPFHGYLKCFFRYSVCREAQSYLFSLVEHLNTRGLKVTMHLQGCLACKRCSASGLNCRYLNPYIKLKLIGLAIRLHRKKFGKKTNCRIFHDS